MEPATEFLDGQALATAKTDSSAKSTFTFVLGGVLTTTPFDEKSEQWMLYQPDGSVLSLRADGMYCLAPANTKAQDEEWTRVWEP